MKNTWMQWLHQRGFPRRWRQRLASNSTLVATHRSSCTSAKWDPHISHIKTAFTYLHISHILLHISHINEQICIFTPFTYFYIFFFAYFTYFLHWKMLLHISHIFYWKICSYIFHVFLHGKVRIALRNRWLVAIYSKHLNNWIVF